MSSKYVILDTNVLIDYSGIGTAESDYANALRLVEELLKKGIAIVVTPTILKDFEYLIRSRMKMEIGKERGQITPEDAEAAAECALKTLELVKGFCFVASEGEGETELARLLLKNHRDFEDNLITAVSKRIGAAYIVTRDAAFINHSIEKCITPEKLLSLMDANIAF